MNTELLNSQTDGAGLSNLNIEMPLKRDAGDVGNMIYDTFSGPDSIKIEPHIQSMHRHRYNVPKGCCGSANTNGMGDNRQRYSDVSLNAGLQSEQPTPYKSPYINYPPVGSFFRPK